MIDEELRRIFEAENRTHAANERASAAMEARDDLRLDVRRLEKETLITCAIANELFSTLVGLAPHVARCASESVLSHHDKYRDNPEFPNVSELLATLARTPEKNAAG